MQIQISNEHVAIHVAKAAGFETVEEYVNRMIKQAYDFEAVREGIADVKAGRVTPLAEFDRDFREEMGFAPRSDA
jgi:hypothetical protein